MDPGACLRRTQQEEWLVAGVAFGAAWSQFSAATRLAVLRLDPSPPPSSHVIAIRAYVDGSGATEQLGASWAYVVLLDTDDGKSHLGWFETGHVDTHPASPQYLGADEPTSFAAEVTAQCRLALAILSYMKSMSDRVVVRIGFDSTSAASASCGATLGAKHAKLVALSASVWAAVNAAHQCVWTQLFSHKGHVWNELVDVLCTCTSMGVMAASLSVPPVGQLVASDVCTIKLSYLGNTCSDTKPNDWRLGPCVSCPHRRPNACRGQRPLSGMRSLRSCV